MEIKIIFYPRKGKYKPVFKSPKTHSWGSYYEYNGRDKVAIEFDDLEAAIEFCKGQAEIGDERGNARTVWASIVR